MNDDQRSTIESVRSALAENPGKKIQDIEVGKEISLAAVCVILRPGSTNGLDVLMIKRRDLRSDPWSGQMAFPGGHYVKTDQDLRSTAFREVLEETSINLRNCSMLGTLDEIIPGNRQIRVTPYVALAPGEIEVKINESEVAKYFWIPISFFSDSKKNRTTYSFERSGTKLTVPSYLFSGQYVIWGMSYRIIVDFLAKAYPKKSLD